MSNDFDLIIIYLKREVRIYTGDSQIDSVNKHIYKAAEAGAERGVAYSGK